MSDDTPTPMPPPAPASVASTSAAAEAVEVARPPIKNLILDAAPLLTLTPLRGMASKYIIAPQVLAEIRDKRAREHFDRLSLLEGVEVQIRDVDAVSLAKGERPEETRAQADTTDRAHKVMSVSPSDRVCQADWRLLCPVPHGSVRSRVDVRCRGRGERPLEGQGGARKGQSHGLQSTSPSP